MPIQPRADGFWISHNFENSIVEHDNLAASLAHVDIKRSTGTYFQGTYDGIPFSISWAPPHAIMTGNGDLEPLARAVTCILGRPVSITYVSQIGRTEQKFYEWSTRPPAELLNELSTSGFRDIHMNNKT